MHACMMLDHFLHEYNFKWKEIEYEFRGPLLKIKISLYL